jgi:hypothetical protein
MVPVDDSGNRRQCTMMDKKKRTRKKENELKLNECQYDKVSRINEYK